MSFFDMYQLYPEPGVELNFGRSFFAKISHSINQNILTLDGFYGRYDEGWKLRYVVSCVEDTYPNIKVKGPKKARRYKFVEYLLFFPCYGDDDLPLKKEDFIKLFEEQSIAIFDREQLTFRNQEALFSQIRELAVEKPLGGEEDQSLP